MPSTIECTTVKIIPHEVLEKNTNEHREFHQQLHDKYTLSLDADLERFELPKNDLRENGALAQYRYFAQPVFAAIIGHNKMYGNNLLSTPQIRAILDNIVIDGKPYPIPASNISDSDKELARFVQNDLSLKLWDNLHGKGPMVCAVTSDKEHKPIVYDINALQRHLSGIKESEGLDDYTTRRALRPPTKPAWYKRLFSFASSDWRKEISDYKEKLKTYEKQIDIAHKAERIWEWNDKHTEEVKRAAENANVQKEHTTFTDLGGNTPQHTTHKEEQREVKPRELQ